MLLQYTCRSQAPTYPHLWTRPWDTKIAKLGVETPKLKGALFSNKVPWPQTQRYQHNPGTLHSTTQQWSHVGNLQHPTKAVTFLDKAVIIHDHKRHFKCFNKQLMLQFSPSEGLSHHPNVHVSSTEINPYYRCVEICQSNIMTQTCNWAWQSPQKCPNLTSTYEMMSPHKHNHVNACTNRLLVRAYNLFIILSLSLWSHYTVISSPTCREPSLPKVKAPKKKRKVCTLHHTLIQTLRGWLSLWMTPCPQNT